MKKEILILSIITFFMFSYIVIADDTTTPTTPTTPDLSASVSNLNSNSANALNTQVEIPSYLSLITKVLLGIDGTVTLQLLVLTIAVWLFFFFTVTSLLKIVPFIGSGAKSWILGFLITGIIAISGAVGEVTNYFLNIGGLISIARQYGWVMFVFVLLVLLVLLFVILKVLSVIRKRIELEEAKEEGQDIAKGAMWGRVLEMFGRKVSGVEK